MTGYALWKSTENKELSRMPSTPRHIRRSYRRFKYENQYDSPLLILFCDTCIALARLLVIGALFLTIWLFATGSWNLTG